MKGTARPDSLTGKVQRALTDEWSTQSEIAARAGLYDYKKPTTIRALLERLVSEGRAEWNIDRTPLLSSPGTQGRTNMSGGMLIVRWRKKAGSVPPSELIVGSSGGGSETGPADKPTGVARSSQRATEEPQPPSGDGGNAVSPVAPTPEDDA